MARPQTPGRDNNTKKSYARVRSALAWLAVSCVGMLAACEGGDVRRNANSDVALLDDGQITLSSGVSDAPLIDVDTRLLGTSANGRVADLELQWSLAPEAQPAIRRSTTLVVTARSADGGTEILTRERVAVDELDGEIDVAIPVDTPVTEITLGLEGLVAGLVDDLPAVTSVSLPNVLTVPPTPVDQITSLQAELVPNSYRSEIENGRRWHRFAVRVEGELADGAPNQAGPVSITGLDQDTSRHFTAFEGGINDPESPVTARFEEQRVTVYLIMDVSSSVSLAGAADDLIDAVARTVLTLAPFAQFDYRVFASDVYEIESLRDLNFDDLNDSGTAFYRAVDSAIDDAESHHGDVLMIAFTDGRDLASRNFYPAFLSHEQVLEHVVNRLENVVEARQRLSGSRFEAHFVSLGSDIDTAALERLARAGSGAHYASFENNTVGDAFAHLTRGVLGHYELEYSSQQLAGDAPLVLQVQANGVLAQPVELPVQTRPDTSN